MNRIINRDNLASFAYVNDAICKKPIGGIVIKLTLAAKRRFEQYVIEDALSAAEERNIL